MGAKRLKADVLSGIETVKVCTSYMHRGREVGHPPFAMGPEHLQPVYTELEGWHEDLTCMTSPSQLPESLSRYIRFIEDAIGTPIRIVSVGPDREQTIYL